MNTSNHQLVNLPSKSPEQIMTEERIHDVLLLLENLSYREETTVKLILDCLYDVGATNLINQKVRSRSMNRLLKMMAKFSKPVFRMIAWQWFKKNCPQLITNWLYEQVKFASIAPQTAARIVENSQIQPPSSINLIEQTQEIKSLRSQVRLLITICLITITSFGSSFVWLSYKLEQAHLQTREAMSTQIKVKKATANDAN
ncbi:hypothetical protein CLI64_19350 [Nostoc sp. CENA543]|uniref:hypothetical protein n=1 Tax=Nostoc sp. CENA543 TaxID=1869241 RepID=UPI000CA3979E|nr:hypothetical protein [Nostoc sp. CENA543]AUT02373.1 hypothetical protein CLI64_19350 [Nostoc sp. CENA543]